MDICFHFRENHIYSSEKRNPCNYFSVFFSGETPKLDVRKSENSKHVMSWHVLWKSENFYCRILNVRKVPCLCGNIGDTLRSNIFVWFFDVLESNYTDTSNYCNISDFWRRIPKKFYKFTPFHPSVTQIASCLHVHFYLDHMATCVWKG